MNLLTHSKIFCAQISKPGRVGIAYHLFRIYVGNLCGCGMNEMGGTDLLKWRCYALAGSLKWWIRR